MSMDTLRYDERWARANALKLIGYWAPAPRSYLCTSSTDDDGEPAWPDIRRAVCPEWRVAEREQLIAYLENGHPCRGFMGCSACRFECRAKYEYLGSGELTDGEWIWPEGLPHYVRRHGIMLPEEFVASASTRKWKVPPIDQIPVAARYRDFGNLARAQTLPPKELFSRYPHFDVDTSVWAEWAKVLPGIAETPIAPDPRVLDRFCLSIQGPDSPDPLMADFEEVVWNTLRSKYGRYEMCMGRPIHDIEWISMNHHASIVAQVLDGLRRYGLFDRVSVVSTQADLVDWHRDRQVTIWPQ